MKLGRLYAASLAAAGFAGVLSVAAWTPARSRHLENPNLKAIELQQTVDYYIGKPKELTNAVKAMPLSSTGGLATFPVPVNTKAIGNGPNCTANMIVPVTYYGTANTSKLKFPQDLLDHSNGYYLGKIRVDNSSGCFSQLPLKPGASAYLFVELGTDSVAHARMVDSATATDFGEWVVGVCPKTHGTASKDENGIRSRRYACVHDKGGQWFVSEKGTSKEVSLKSLQYAPKATGPVKATVPARISLVDWRKLFGPEDKETALIWIACSDGCCYVDPVP